MEIEKEKTLDYLKKAGVNPGVIKYIQEKNSLSIIKEVQSMVEKTMWESAGQDRYQTDDNIVNKLKSGSDKFSITPEGNLWIKKETNPQETKRNDNVRLQGQLFGMPSFARDNTIDLTTDYTYIESKDDQIREQEITVNRHNDMQGQSYSGSLQENRYNSNMKRTFSKRAKWDRREEKDIPDEELDTRTEEFSSDFSQETEFPEKRDFTKENFRNWGSLMEKPRSMAEKDFQKDIASETNKRKTTIDKIKNFFTRFQSKEHEMGNEDRRE